MSDKQVVDPRRFRNLLLKPLLQVKIGLYSILLSSVFVITFCSVLLVSFHRLFELILDLTDLRQEVVDVIQNGLLGIAGWLMLIVVVYFFASVLLSVVFTHRLIGPTIAFRRHIRELASGNYDSKVNLRKYDAFIEVADELNNLADELKKTKQG